MHDLDLNDDDTQVLLDSPETATEADDDGPAIGDPTPIVRRARAKTIAMKRLTKEELRIGALLYLQRAYWRPKARGECANVSRPCPYVSCK